MTRAVFLATLIAGLSLNAAATTYHVSRAGSDLNDGGTAAPLQSLAAGAARLQPGDELVIHGGNYHEALRFTVSGTPDAPIKVRSAPGEVVCLRGTRVVNGWEPAGVGLWRAHVDLPVEQVFLNGEFAPQACWPNTSIDPMKRVWAKAGKDSDKDGLHDPDLPAVNLTGARIHLLPGLAWVSWAIPVTGTDLTANRISFSAAWDQSAPYRVERGSRYYLFDHPALIDAPGEWHYDTASKTLTMMFPADAALSDGVVEVKAFPHAIDFSGASHVRVEGFRIFGATVNLGTAVNCEVIDCHVRYASHFTNADGWAKRNDTGVIIGGSGNRVSRSSVVFSAGNGISLFGSDNAVENCYVSDVDYMAMDCAAVWADGERNSVRQCTLVRAGRSVLIHRELKNGRIEYNDMSEAGLLTGDLGITYCFGTDGAGTVLAYNWVHDNRAQHTGVGIYIDNGSRNFVIHHNVSWGNPDSGIRLNTPSNDNLVCNNTILRNGNSVSFWGPDGQRDQSGTRLYNNLFTDEFVVGDGIEVANNVAAPESAVRDMTSRDFRPAESSPAVDAGRPVEGVTGGAVGHAPDAGAYEAGGDTWRAGHDWGTPPLFR